MAAVEGRQKGEDDDGDNEEECMRLKSKADAACQRVEWLYDTLVKFVRDNRMMENRKEMESMMKLKKEAEESA